MRPIAALIALTLVLAPVAVACGDDDTDVSEEVGELTDDAQARAAAEGLRAALADNDTAVEEGLRSITAINQAIDSVPGDPEFTGVEDTTGDGLDDDGDVQVTVGEGRACVSIAEGEPGEATGTNRTGDDEPAGDDTTSDDTATDEDDGIGDSIDRLGEIDVTGGEC